MRESTWVNPLPGADPQWGNRLVAVRCAANLFPDSIVSSGAYQAGEVTELARSFEAWLDEAKDEQDRLVRRNALVITCDKAGVKLPKDRIIAFVKEIHHYVIRG